MCETVYPTVTISSDEYDKLRNHSQAISDSGMWISCSFVLRYGYHGSYWKYVKCTDDEVKKLIKDQSDGIRLAEDWAGQLHNAITSFNKLPWYKRLGKRVKMPENR